MKKFTIEVTQQHIDRANSDGAKIDRAIGGTPPAFCVIGKGAGEAVLIALDEIGYEYIDISDGTLIIGNTPKDSITYHNCDELAKWVFNSYHYPERCKPITIEARSGKGCGHPSTKIV